MVLRLAGRRTELSLLAPVVLLVPLGVVVTHIAQTGLFETGPLAVAIAFAGLVLGAHFVLAWAGHLGDEMLLPAVAGLGAVGIVMLNRLPQDLAGNPAFDLGMVGTQLVWFGVGLAALAGVLAAPIYQVNPLMGADLIIVVFAVVVIGGMGSIMGSIVTGFGLGVIEGLTKVFYPEASNTVIFVIMALVLLVKPAGLFGRTP